MQRSSVLGGSYLPVRVEFLAAQDFLSFLLARRDMLKTSVMDAVNILNLFINIAAPENDDC